MFSVLSLNFGFCLVLFKRLTLKGMNVVKFRSFGTEVPKNLCESDEFMTLFSRLLIF